MVRPVVICVGCIKFHLGEVVGEVQDVLHQVPAERDGQFLGDNKFDKTKNEKKDQKRDSRGGDLEIWDGSVVNSQTTFLPEQRGYL